MYLQLYPGNWPPDKWHFCWASVVHRCTVQYHLGLNFPIIDTSAGWPLYKGGVNYRDTTVFEFTFQRKFSVPGKEVSTLVCYSLRLFPTERRSNRRFSLCFQFSCDLACNNQLSCCWYRPRSVFQSRVPCLYPSAHFGPWSNPDEIRQFHRRARLLWALAFLKIKRYKNGQKSPVFRSGTENKNWSVCFFSLRRELLCIHWFVFRARELRKWSFYRFRLHFFIHHAIWI